MNIETMYTIVILCALGAAVCFPGMRVRFGWMFLLVGSMFGLAVMVQLVTG